MLQGNFAKFDVLMEIAKQLEAKRKLYNTREAANSPSGAANLHDTGALALPSGFWHGAFSLTSLRLTSSGKTVSRRLTSLRLANLRLMSRLLVALVPFCLRHRVYDEEVGRDTSS